MSPEIEILELEHEWRTRPRWARVTRPYHAADVIGLRGAAPVEHALARRGAEKLWDRLHSGSHLPVLGRDGIDWYPPPVAGADSEPGSVLDAFARMQRAISAGAACVHLGERLASAGRCGQLDGDVLPPTQEVIQRLVAARLAADVLEVPTLLMVRVRALAADLLSSGPDRRDRPFLGGQGTPGELRTAARGIDHAAARAISYAPYADILWCETSTPDLDAARRFARAVHARLPGKLLAYDCSCAFDWRQQLGGATMELQRELADMGYRFLLVSVAPRDMSVGVRGASGWAPSSSA